MIPTPTPHTYQDAKKAADEARAKLSEAMSSSASLESRRGVMQAELDKVRLMGRWLRILGLERLI